MEADLVQLSDVIAQKENMLRMEIEQKIQQHQRWNQSHVDLTRDALAPVNDHIREPSFRVAKTQYLMTPPASVSSEMDIDHASPKEDSPFDFRFDSPPPEEDEHPAFRRRIGRLNRLWIDRRGITSPAKEMDSDTLNRWKYDQDDDDEPVIYTVDPFNTRAIKYRSTIPSMRSQNLALVAHGSAGSPPVRQPPPATAQPPT
jgi:enhancer of polycomb-like protein